MKLSGKKEKWAEKKRKEDFGYYHGAESEQFSFIRVPRLLFAEKYQELVTDAKLLYGLMLDRMGLSKKNGWCDNRNRVYIIYTLEDIKKTLGCSTGKASNLLSELDRYGLIYRVRQGQGKPTRIYVGKLAREDGSSGPESEGGIGKDKDQEQKPRLPKNESLDSCTPQNEQPRLAKNGSLGVHASKHEQSGLIKNESLDFQNLEARSCLKNRSCTKSEEMRQ